MKIVFDDCIYVQKKDISFLRSIGIKIPKSICGKVNLINQNEFIRYYDIWIMDYFKNLDYIVDYNIYRNINKEEFEDINMDIDMKLDILDIRFISMSQFETMDNLNLLVEIEKLEYMRNELRNIFNFNLGEKHISLPDGVEYPDGYKKNKKRVKMRRNNKKVL